MHALIELRSLLFLSQRPAISRASRTAAHLAPGGEHTIRNSSSHCRRSTRLHTVQREVRGPQYGLLRAMTAQPEAPLAEAETQAQTAKQALPRADDIKLDRSAFTEVLKLKALRVPTARCQELMKRFTGCVWRDLIVCLMRGMALALDITTLACRPAERMYAYSQVHLPSAQDAVHRSRYAGRGYSLAFAVRSCEGPRSALPPNLTA